MAAYRRCARGLEVQSLIFPRSWGARKAASWARSHGFRAPKVDVTESSVRLRQRPPSAFVNGSFRTIVVSARDGVRAIVGCPKPGRESDRQSARRFRG